MGEQLKECVHERMESIVAFVYIFHVVEFLSSRFGKFPMRISFSEKNLPVGFSFKTLLLLGPSRSSTT